MELQWPLILFTFFNCVAAGTFLVQGVLTLAGKGKAMQMASLVTSIVALAVGGIAVFFHLENPLRMLNGFGHITSGITIELIVIILFAIAAVLYFLMMRRSEEGVAPKWCAVLAVVMGVVLPVAVGDSYLMAALPVWDTPLLPLYYVANTVMLGGLTALVIALVTKVDDAKDLSAKTALAGSVATLAVTLVYALMIGGMADCFTSMEYYFDPTLPDVPMREVADITGALLAGSLAPAFWLGQVVVGCVAPAALTALMVMGKAKPEQGKALAFGAVACAIVGSFVWRVLLYVLAVNALIQFQWAL